MRIVSLADLKPGQKVGRPITSESGRLLIHQETVLTQKIINRLQYFKIGEIVLKDKEEYNRQKFMDDSEREKAVESIKQTFQGLSEPTIAERTYVAIQTAEELQSVVGQVKNLVNKREDLVSLLSEAFLFDDYLFIHSLNVTIYTLTIARELGFSDNELSEIGLGAMLHDIGKMKIPREILMKPGKLSPKEFEVIKNHTTCGLHIVKNIPNIPETVLRCVNEHHERLDGSGYPNGLVKEKIHIYSRVLGVADVFDALTTNRVYRNSKLPHEALEILYTGSGSLFEREIIEIFRKNVAIYPNGITITLSDGRKAVVVKQNNELADRPVVRIMEENGIPLVETYDVDLAKTFNLVVRGIDR